MGGGTEKGMENRMPSHEPAAPDAAREELRRELENAIAYYLDTRQDDALYVSYRVLTEQVMAVLDRRASRDAHGEKNAD